MSQYSLFNSARFTSLVSIVPVEIFVTFQMADNPGFYNFLGLSLIFPLFIELALQAKFSRILDTHSRKTLLIVNELTNAGVLSTALLLSWVSGNSVFLDFIALISVEIFLFITYQTYMALAKEIVADRSVSRYNGLSEIISQLPVLIGTFAASVIFLEVGLRGLFLIGIVLHAFAIYQLHKVREGFGKTSRAVEGKSLMGSFPYMRKNFRRILFIFFLNFPFMAIMAGNFLKPIFLASYLHGNASILADSDGVYALFAMFAGLAAPRLMARIGEMRSIYVFAAVFFLGSVMTPAVPILGFYLLFQMQHGLGNAGVRIARNSMAMRTTPLEEMGRFNGSVSFLTILGRLVLLGFSVISLDYLGLRLLILLMGLIVVTAVLIARFMWKNNPDVNARFNLKPGADGTPQ